MANKEQTYNQWLNKKIEATEKVYENAEMNYQMTGDSKYYRAMVNKENELRAFRDSLGILNKRDKHVEGWQRVVSSVIDIAENAKKLLLPEEALDGVIEELYKMKWL